MFCILAIVVKVCLQVILDRPHFGLKDLLQEVIDVDYCLKDYDVQVHFQDVHSVDDGHRKT